MSETSTAHRLAPEVIEQLDLTFEHFNSSHADTVLFLVRGATGLTTATGAELVAADALGIDVDATVDDRPCRARIAFDRALSTTPDIRGELLDRLETLRLAAPDGLPLTSLEREIANRTSLPTFVTRVEQVRRLSPNLCEIVVAGGLDGFTSHGGDQFVFVMAPRPGGHLITDGYTMAAYQASDDDDTPFGAYYTVRRWEPDTGRLTLWAVLHGHDHGVGAWAASCRRGDRVAVWGPREGFGATPGADPRLFVGDESGLAAIAALIEELPDGATATVIVETVDRMHEIDLPVGGRSGIDVVWCHRGDDAPGTGTRLLDEVCALDLDGSALVAFGALESRQATAIRKHLRKELGMPASRVSFTGYWRR